MIRLKSPKELEVLKEAGIKLARVLDAVSTAAQVGVTPEELDHLARSVTAQEGATPSFLNYAPRGHEPFPAALCVSVNEAVVHGLPGKIPLAEGDIVSLDAGLIYKGMYVDSARTVAIGQLPPETQTLLEVTKEALRRGIAAATLGNTTGDIGYAIQSYVERNGFSVVRELVGHGVGYGVHEDPSVPNFGVAGKGVKLKTGLVIAIEPMVTKGDPAVVTAEDGWTVETRSGQLAAHEEHTIAITPAGPQILTAV